MRRHATFSLTGSQAANMAQIPVVLVLGYMYVLQTIAYAAGLKYQVS